MIITVSCKGAQFFAQFTNLNRMAFFKLLLGEKKLHSKSKRLVRSCCLQSTGWQMVQMYLELFLQFLDAGFAVKSLSEG